MRRYNEEEIDRLRSVLDELGSGCTGEIEQLVQAFNESLEGIDFETVVDTLQQFEVEVVKEKPEPNFVKFQNNFNKRAGKSSNMKLRVKQRKGK